jgi:hypothetical protein
LSCVLQQVEEGESPPEVNSSDDTAAARQKGWQKIALQVLRQMHALVPGCIVVHKRVSMLCTMMSTCAV